MVGFAAWHWLFILFVLVGIPALAVGLIVRRSRHRTVPDAADPAAQLRELAQLRQRGLLTASEFERKRSELAKTL